MEKQNKDSHQEQQNEQRLSRERENQMVERLEKGRVDCEERENSLERRDTNQE